MGIKPLHTVILKVAGICNLNCSYCYVYNKGDKTWRARPRLMSADTFRIALRRVAAHCVASGQETVQLTFHGGEPCLLGPQRFTEWIELARHELQDTAALKLTVQTNGTLIDGRWTSIFRKYGVQVGLSIDGPPDIHDRARVDHRNRGSYEHVTRGIRHLKDADVPFGALCVIPLGADPMRVHRHLLDLGCDSISYLLPDFTHDSIAEVRARFGSTPCSNFLIPIFGDWWFNSEMSTTISLFTHMARIILGGESRADSLGSGPLGFLVVETDGEIEGLDCLRVCRDGITKTGFNVHTAGFGVLATRDDLNARAIFSGLPTSGSCRGCPEESTCGGGYLPHRYSRDRGFDNPSVWCADLLKVFTHLRLRLEVTHEETALRRLVLREMAAESSQSRGLADA